MTAKASFWSIICVLRFKKKSHSTLSLPLNMLYYKRKQQKTILNHLLTTHIAEFLCKRYTNMCTAALGKGSNYPKIYIAMIFSLCLDYIAFGMIWTKLTYYTAAYRQPTVQWVSHQHSVPDNYTSEIVFYIWTTIIINLKPMLMTICQSPCPKKITQNV
jgi:hypothetical protein